MEPAETKVAMNLTSNRLRVLLSADFTTLAEKMTPLLAAMTGSHRPKRGGTPLSPRELMCLPTIISLPPLPTVLIPSKQIPLA